MIATVHFLVTSRCRLRCRFCLNAWKDKRVARPQAKAFAKDASYFQQLAIVDALAKENVRFLVITGGEPFQHPHLASLVRHAAFAGLQVIIQTNGEGITEGFLEDTKGCVCAIQVSLEGTRREHQALTRSKNFSRVIRNMRMVREHGVTLMTNLTITTHNKDCLSNYVKLIEGLGVAVASFTRLYPAGLGRESFAELSPSLSQMTAFYRELEGLQATSTVRFFIQGGIPWAFFDENRITLPYGRCSALSSEAAIQPNGDVTMCPSSPAVLGNILWSSLAEIMIRARETRGWHHETSCSETSCNRSCILFQDAGWQDPLDCQGIHAHAITKLHSPDHSQASV